MSNSTKTDLEIALKKLLLQKPVDKITIRDLTTECGISRMAFYYHFKDIYDLIEWVCEEGGRKALQGKKTYDTWQEGLYQVFEAVLGNKPFILNVYRHLERERIEAYLYKLTYGLLEGVVEEQAKELPIAEEDKRFIAEFYKYSFVGIMLDWIRQGMKTEPEELVEKISITLHGNIKQSVHNFYQKQGK